MPVVQPHDFIRCSRAGPGIRDRLFGVVLGASLGHYIAGELAYLGRPLAPVLEEGDPGFEQALGGGPQIAL
jgi:hypothetical protein